MQLWDGFNWLNWVNVWQRLQYSKCRICGTVLFATNTRHHWESYEYKSMHTKAKSVADDPTAWNLVASIRSKDALFSSLPRSRSNLSLRGTWSSTGPASTCRWCAADGCALRTRPDWAAGRGSSARTRLRYNTWPILNRTVVYCSCTVRVCALLGKGH